MSGLEALPWRGPGPGRPDGLPLPPRRQPLRFGGVNRKRWRYLGAYSEELMLCAARVQVGPVGQTFWAVWDRAGGELHERTRVRRPFARGQVWTEDEAGRRVDHAPDAGSTVRIEASCPGVGPVSGTLDVGGGEWVESVCPNGEGGFVWTRKRAGVPVEVDLHLGDRRISCLARGIEDESAGYHPRHTVWDWSAGVGALTDGRAVAWNLVEGVNDPARNSERGIWIDGAPYEPGPVSFGGLDGIAFDDGSALAFEVESERAKSDRWPLRYTYRQPFGTFTGALPGGLVLERGMGVMEHQDAVW